MSRNEKKSWMISFGSSVFIGTVLFPLDIQKTLKTVSKTKKNEDLTKASEPISTYYTQLLTPNGPKGRYRALFLNNCAVGFSWGIFRFVYDRVVESAHLNSGKSKKGGFSKQQTAVASLVASFASILGTHPLYNAKYAFILKVWGDKAYELESLSTYFRSIYQEGGIWRFYRGADSAFLSIPSVVFQMILYERMKRILPLKIPANSRNIEQFSKGKEALVTRASNFLIPALWAFTSKVAATSLTYPLNIVRMRQLYPRAAVIRNGGTWHVMKRLVKEEGIGSLYRGFGTHLQRTVAHNSLSLALFELWKMKNRKREIFNSN